ncbi:hypothetical protein E2C01_033861 [Portunus trituberculatus]|uniref:Uncharacterized protein n=1 Tax=Portunus trituberculatus TaxID=210409 RepID=A0A5B7F3V1_PORTR|nr:hypothetical protein [Portunus trituberculatus]
MMSLRKLRDNREFSPYLSSAEWADEDKTSSSALSEADVEGPAVARSARFNGLKKENIEEGPAVAGSADMVSTHVIQEAPVRGTRGDGVIHATPPVHSQY